MLRRAPAAWAAALWKFFHVYYQRQPADDPDATDWLTGQKLTYDVEHSNTPNLPVRGREAALHRRRRR